jgi:hypothetical protein
MPGADEVNRNREAIKAAERACAPTPAADLPPARPPTPPGPQPRPAGPQ